MMNLENSNATHNVTDDFIEKHLNSGAVMVWSDTELFLGAGAVESLAMPPKDWPAFYAPDFYLRDSEPWKVFSQCLLVTKELWQTRLTEWLAEHSNSASHSTEFSSSKSKTPDSLSKAEWLEPDFTKFSAVFADIQENIRTGQIQKAVPFVQSQAHFSMQAAELAKLQLQLLKTAESLNIYGIWSNSKGILGLTPETLFQLSDKGDQLRTMALAGTRASEKIVAQPLLQDPKETFEHSLVVEDLLSRLAPLGPVQRSDTYEWSIGPLTHLRTDIEMKAQTQLPIASVFNEYVTLLHPTSALGFYPRQSDWRKLQKWDAGERGHFGAPFGFISSNHGAKVLVAIRNIQWRENQVFIGSGCGVVSESDLQNEWQELELKRRAVRARFGI